MKTDEESGGKIKTFLAERKPEPIKVFQFTKEMLPEREYYEVPSRTIDCDFHSSIYFQVYSNKITNCWIRGYKGQEKFEVGDYIAEDREGNYFVIKREEFEKDWVVVK